MSQGHEHFMRAALEEAARGGADGNAAVGSVVVKDGTIVGLGRNLVTSTLDPTAHAEVVALRDAARALGRADLTGYTLYTTFEPCAMCCGALMVSGIATLVMGARHDAADSRWGAYSVEKLLALASWGDRMQVVPGVLAQEGAEVRRQWEARNAGRGA